MGTKAILSWSGGKDSAMALYEIRRAGDMRDRRTPDDHHPGLRPGVHARRQDHPAGATGGRPGTPLDKIYLARNESQEGYDAKMRTYLARCRERGIETVIFGDLFLQDVRQYRERNLAQASMQAVFPLWQQDTHALAERFLDTGFKAIITCVDLHALTPEFAGRRLRPRVPGRSARRGGSLRRARRVSLLCL